MAAIRTYRAGNMLLIKLVVNGIAGAIARKVTPLSNPCSINECELRTVVPVRDYGHSPKEFWMYNEPGLPPDTAGIPQE